MGSAVERCKERGNIMEERGCRILCWNCARETDYIIKGRKAYRSVKGTDYTYNESYAVCSECGEEITAPGLDDENEKRFENLYRKAHQLITVEEIKHILRKYDIEKRPLSNLMGFGELTITRYLEGQLPSRRYSDALYEVLRQPVVMRRYLETRKENITESAYRKTLAATAEQERQTRFDSKIELIAQYVIHSCDEITNFSLQKLLYYAKAVFFVKYGMELFSEQCEAWVCGPVYPVIYDKYKKLDNVFLEDCDLMIDYPSLLKEEERRIIEHVAKGLGIYSGWVLQEITHREQPWIAAREGLDDTVPARNPILDKDINSYFIGVDKQYHITERAGLTRYLESLGVIDVL